MRMAVGSLAAVLAAAVLVAFLPGGTGPVTISAALAQQADQPAAGPESGQAAAAETNEATRAKLAKVISADFIDTPLGDVLDYLTELTKVQFYVNRRSLESAGIEPDAPVTINLKNVPAEMVLRLALRGIGLGYTLDHGVAIVESEEELSRTLEVRVYDVSDLIRPPAESKAAAMSPPAPSAAPAPPGAASPPATAPGARADVDVTPFGPSGYEQYLESYARYSAGSPAGREMATLIRLIESTIDPTSWQPSAAGPTQPGAGPYPAIVPYRDSLVVSQVPDVQRQIEKLLDDLRAVKARQDAAEKDGG